MWTVNIMQTLTVKASVHVACQNT